LCSDQNQDAILRALQRTPTTPVGSVTTESPMSGVGSQRRPASLSRITGADNHGVFTSSVLPDRKMFFGQAVPNIGSSVINHNSPPQLPPSRPLTHSSVSQSFESNVTLPDAEGSERSRDFEENGDHFSSSSPSSNISNGITNRNRRRIIQSMSADSALLPIRSGPFPDNELPDSSPGSLHHSPVLTRKSDHKAANPLGTHSPNNETDSTKKDPFGSLVSLHDDCE